MAERAGILAAIACVAIAAGAGFVLVGQRAEAAGQGLEERYAVRGKVVNAVTGEPIQNALVTLTLAESRAVFSGVDGSFEFRDVEAGQAYVMAKRPGYFEPQMARMAGRATEMTTQPVTVGRDQPPVVLRLVPEAIITGRVTGDSGAPIEEIGVRICFEGAEQGRRTLIDTGEAETDGNGEFRRAELPAGRYFVFVGPGREPEQVSNAKDSAGFGYGAVFYPGGTDLASAAPIDLTPGKHAELDVRLPTVPFFRVSGTVRGIPTGERTHLEILDAVGTSFDGDSASARDGGKFRFPALAAGSYTIEAKDQREALYATRSLLVKSDMTGLDLTLMEGVSIPVSVREEADPTVKREQGPGYEQITRGNTITRRYRQGRAVDITLVPQKIALQWNRGIPPATTGSKDEFTLEHVQAGTYEVRFETGGAFYVQSAVSGATDLLREKLTVAPGAAVERIQVVVREDFGTLEGKVAYDPNTGPAIVVAISEDTPQWNRTAHVTGSDGTYTIKGLAPGSYRVLAVDRVDNFAYAEPDVARKYESKMKEVTIGANRTAHADPELVMVGSQAP